MKYFTAIALAFFAGCYATEPAADEVFEVTATVYERGTPLHGLLGRRALVLARAGARA